MTHSHDTSTPAMSAEIEEALRPFANAVFNDNGDMTVTPVYDRNAYVAAYFAHKRLTAPNPSPAAKGGDAGLFFYLRDGGPSRFYRTWAEVMEDAEEQIAYCREIAQEEGEWPSTADEIAIYACEFETDEPEDDGVLMAQSRPVPSGVDDDGREHFEYAMKLVLSTPTEGPASQAEGMGEEAAADGSQAPLSDGRHRHLSRITEIVRGADSRMEAEQIALGYLRGAMSNEERAERAARDWAVAKWHEEVANRPLQNTHRRSLDTTWRQVIRYFGGDDERICGPRHDDLVATHDGMDFATPGTQVKPLEWQRFDNARTVTYRAMCPLGGIYYITSANEDPSFDGWKSHLGEFASLEAAKAAQQAEHEAKVRGCLARAALTPPETAEAVPVGPFVVMSANYSRPFMLGCYDTLNQAVMAQCGSPEKWHVFSRHPVSDPEAARLREDLERVTQERDDYLATASDPAPATDDRERLVEALRELTEACEADCGMPDEWDDDNEPVGASAERPMALTFGILRRARAALATEASR